MDQEKDLEFKLKYDGDIVDGHAISIRTLGNTLPHFQRALDKAVMFEEYGKVRKNAGIHRADYLKADLMLQVVEEGSVILPLYGKLKKEAISFLNWALSEPYQKALVGVLGTSRKEQIATYKTRHREKDLGSRTQQDIMDRPDEENRKFARSAALADIDQMFNVLRTAGDHSIDIEIVKPEHQAIYSFNRSVAKNFNKIVAVPYPTEPVIYKGKYRGYKQTSDEEHKFEIYLVSSFSKQMMHIFVHSLADLAFFTTLDHNAEICFWASPLAKYGAFDAYNGAAIFIGMVN